jgi:uncharacterized protein YndB with AHSA1/START domain
MPSRKKESGDGANGAKPFIISRVFDAPRDVVWKAHTECAHLKHWWGPKGFVMTHCEIDLRPGGFFHYGLMSPDGQAIWGKFLFREVDAPERMVYIVSFSDAERGTTRHPMNPDWPLEVLSTTTFTERNGKTTLTIRWAPHNATAAERAAFDAGHDGMRMGFGGSLEQLAAYLAEAKG